ncbi:hypothetical protein H2200_004550 [Cladophialophora chaetospira]|uniref:HAD-like protein n=1 Tax=Cladophialophora chaetospira TaxID=386627 RepID=A0AA38XDB3_9EURO|nr:hypothetical protein H2200_004550 [Cladophialophora chaetospira]
MVSAETVLPPPVENASADTMLFADVPIDPLEGKMDLGEETQNTKAQAQTMDSEVDLVEPGSPASGLEPGISDSASDLSSPATSIEAHEVLEGRRVRQDSGVGLEKTYADPSSAAIDAPGKVSIENEWTPANASAHERPVPSISALIIDLGDVCCNWTAPQSLPISPAMLHRLLKTRTWYEYDSGALTQEDCYNNLATQYGVSAADVGEAFKQATSSLSPNEDTFEVLRNLKRTYNDSLKIYLMSNIPSPEWESVRADTRYDWTLFDGFFPSGQVGMCKPELRFFWHVLESIKLKPKDVVFIDDNAENVLAARSLGIRCLRYKVVNGLKQFIKSVFDDPIKRGQEWLQSNAKNMWSETTQGREVRDNFAQLFLYEACRDLDLVSMTFYERTWNYYIEKPIDTVEKHPDDVDTTSMAMTILPQDTNKANGILDEVLTYTNKDGIIMTYFDTKRPRIDPIVCVNAVRFFYKYNRGECTPALEPTKSWISDVLFYRAYLDGTYYYPTGEVFLYLFSRLLVANADSDMYRSTSSLLRERLGERIGAPGDALELAMRVIGCVDMGITNEVDFRKLESMQEEDGSWPIGWLCQTGKISLKIGNKGVTTAFAVKAIEKARKR